MGFTKINPYHYLTIGCANVQWSYIWGVHHILWLILCDTRIKEWTFQWLCRHLFVCFIRKKTRWVFRSIANCIFKSLREKRPVAATVSPATCSLPSTFQSVAAINRYRRYWVAADALKRNPRVFVWINQDHRSIVVIQLLRWDIGYSICGDM